IQPGPESDSAATSRAWSYHTIASSPAASAPATSPIEVAAASRAAIASTSRPSTGLASFVIPRLGRRAALPLLAAADDSNRGREEVVALAKAVLDVALVGE